MSSQGYTPGVADDLVPKANDGSLAEVRALSIVR